MSDILIIQSAPIFSALSARYSDIEIWPDADFSEGGYAYYWLVSQSDGSTRLLSYLRCRDGVCEQRTYDEAGDDLWISADPAAA